MRRKVEVLKYSKNANNISLQNYGDNISKKIRNALLSESTCATRPTRNTECNVPGRPFIIQYNPNIPLINYEPQNTRTFIVSDTNNDTFFIYYEPNYIANENQKTTDANNNKIIDTQTIHPPLKITFYNSVIDTSIVNIPFEAKIGISFVGNIQRETELTLQLNTFDVFIYTNNLLISRTTIAPTTTNFLLQLNCILNEGSTNTERNVIFNQNTNLVLKEFFALNNANMNVFKVYLIPNFTAIFDNIANVNSINYELLLNVEDGLNEKTNVSGITYDYNLPIFMGDSGRGRNIAKNNISGFGQNPYKMQFL
ncbi:MAG: hypothetical protein EBS86_11720 [Crocinitomicaceae bacterium]|nr:hypothetical protein [Crocinitomicaceae bacterium]